MRISTLSRGFFLGLTSLLCTPGSVFSQGSLTPAGPPAPTMKTLDQVEARAPLAGGTNTVTITTDGSYYLTGNITVSAGNGITINAANVTLDLNGFTVASTAGGGGGYGIYASPNSLTVRNGHIRGTTTYSSSAFAPGGFTEGLYSSGGNNVCLENLNINGVGDTGIYVGGNPNATISRCQVCIAGGSGIIASTTTATIDHCQAQSCGAAGIQGSTLGDCNATSLTSGIAIYSNTASNCYGATNSGIGVYGYNLSNCRGVANTTGTGVNATIAATNCYGVAINGTGLIAQNATNCYGVTFGTGATNYGIDCSAQGAGTGVAVGCTAASNSVALRARLATSCNITTGTTLIGNRYNMPATPEAPGAGDPLVNPYSPLRQITLRSFPIMNSRLPALALICSMAPLLALTVHAQSTIDTSLNEGWGANIGWTHWRASATSGAVIGEYVCSGNVYGANVGWINLGSGAPANGIQYGNSAAGDCGVNYYPTSVPGAAILRGYAYGANIGWIVFEGLGNPSVNLFNGQLYGYAYSANCGWINLGSNTVYVVKTWASRPGQTPTATASRMPSSSRTSAI